jgi:hypothetical protein
MKSVEIVLRRGREKRENDGGGKNLTKIYCNIYVNITMYPLYKYYMVVNFKKKIVCCAHTICGSIDIH